MLTAVTHSFHSVKGTERSAGVTMEFRGAFQCFVKKTQKNPLNIFFHFFNRVQSSIVQQIVFYLFLLRRKKISTK